MMRRELTAAELAGAVLDVIAAVGGALLDQGAWFRLPGTDDEEWEDTGDAYPAREWLDAMAAPGARNCGTTACGAGWTAVLAAPDGTVIEGGFRLRFPDGTCLSVKEYATRRLDLHWREAAYLFEAPRSRDEVIAGYTAIRDGRRVAGLPAFQRWHRHVFDRDFKDESR